jgi:hypothetical protein
MVKAKNKNKGSVLIYIMIIASMAAIILAGLATFVVSRYKNGRYANNREQTFQIAEAGIFWYRWYLAHTIEGKTPLQKKTFWEGGTARGVVTPYEEEVKDPEGNPIGKYSIQVTAPNPDSTIVIVEATGWTYQFPNQKRSVKVRFRQPAWCEYAVVADDAMRFGEGTEVFGPIHSNKGVRFDGVAHNIVSSLVPSYDDPDHCEHYDHNGNCDLNKNEFGVHTHVNAPPGHGTDDAFRSLEAPPTSPVPDRPDVFEAGRELSAPEKSFIALIANFSLMKGQAGDGGLYLGQLTATIQFNCGWVTTGKGKNKITVWTCDETSVPVKGYHIVLKNNHTMDVSMVLNYDASSYQINPNMVITYGGHNYTIVGELPVVNYPVPGNGIVFVENNAWVEGTVNGDHLTIAAADLSPNPVYKDIYINHSILYTDKVGTDANGPDILGLIAQNNISIGLYSDNNLEVDAALLAQKGRVGRNYYSWPTTPVDYVHRNSITVYGSIVTKQRYGFAWTDNTGYNTRNLYFDNNLVYWPPPYFPTGDKYQVDLWEEL